MFTDLIVFMGNTKFDWIVVSLASVDDIAKWSHGAVENPGTINFFTWRPKQHWLFCETIFWPVKNYECSCGKYSWVRYKWIVCERCGVEVTSSRVRRSRMWHIDLASPVLHPWYKFNPSGWIHQLLQLSSYEIDRILTFVKYAVPEEVTESQKKQLIEKLQQTLDAKLAEVDELRETWDNDRKLYVSNRLEIEFNRLKSIVSDLHFGSTILESDYRSIFYKYNDIVKFVSGPEWILEMLQNIDLKKEIKKRLEEYSTLESPEYKARLMSLIKLLINMYVSGVKPENMVLRKLPVIPPAWRPMGGWTSSSSDINLHYRKILMRNIRLRKMIQLWLPDVVKKDEIRLLQESVNNLFNWEFLLKTIQDKNDDEFDFDMDSFVDDDYDPNISDDKKIFWIKDLLIWKDWVFRKNLLWKRVDYSWRTVVTVWPNLKLDECELPIFMALNIFRFFVIAKLIDKKLVYTPNQAAKLIMEKSPIVLKILEDIVNDKYIILNRTPSLYKSRIKAFKIKLTVSKVIRISPLMFHDLYSDYEVLEADQHNQFDEEYQSNVIDEWWLSVHLPLSDEAQKDAKELIASDKNILNTTNGDINIINSNEIILWIYYLTDFFDKRYPDYYTEQEWFDKAPIMWYFDSIGHVLKAFENWDINVKDKIVLKYNSCNIITTVGRTIFNSILPSKLSFINKTQRKKDLKILLNKIYDVCGRDVTVEIANNIKDLWLHYSVWISNAINIMDMKIPMEKYDILKQWEYEANTIYKQFYNGLFSYQERHRFVTEVWTKVKNNVEGRLKWIIWPWNSLYSMVDSGTIPTNNLNQILWIYNLQNCNLSEFEFKWNLIEWLQPSEYFISLFWLRNQKLSNMFNNLKKYNLIKSIYNLCQEVIVRTDDCGTDKSIYFTKEEAELKWEHFADVIYGRVLVKDVKDSNGTVILKKWEMITRDNIYYILNDDWIEWIYYRSPLTCMSPSGVCQKCYGMDLSTRKLVESWAPVWIIAAQSISESATVLTMRSFNNLWVVGWDNVLNGIDRINQLFEVRPPRKSAAVAPFDGTIYFSEKWADRYVNIESEYMKKTYTVEDGYEIVVKKWDILHSWDDYATKWNSKMKVHEDGTVVEVKKDGIVLWVKETSKQSYKW